MIRPGTVVDVPEVRGLWSTWAKSDACPGAWFLVPADDAARNYVAGRGRSYITAKLTKPRGGQTEVVRVVES